MSVKKNFSQDFANNPAMQFMSGILPADNDKDLDTPAELETVDDLNASTEPETVETPPVTVQEVEEKEDEAATAPECEDNRSDTADTSECLTPSKAEDSDGVDVVSQPSETPKKRRRRRTAASPNNTSDMASHIALNPDLDVMRGVGIAQEKRTIRSSVLFPRVLIEKLHAFADATTSSVGYYHASTNDVIINLLDFAFSMNFSPELLKRIKTYQHNAECKDMNQAIVELLEMALNTLNEEGQC